ncbi:MAG: RNase adapter RapZ [Acidobacteriota bacterium]
MNATGSPDPAERPRLVLVTGLSGSGKSTVAKGFEDLGYYVMDNLPLGLLRQLLANPTEHVQDGKSIAVVADVRAGGLAEELPRLVRELDHTRMRPSLLFLEADDNALLRRFSETRRPHPLAPQGPVLEGVSRERALLGDLRALADVVFDTTDWSIHDTRAQVFKEFAGPGHEAAMAITLVSFGFKHGAPPGTDLLFDVRFLPNPYFVPELRDHSGQEEVIRSWLQAVPEYNELIVRFGDLLLYLLPLYRRENRSYLAVGIGCTGGRHRSVAIAEALGEALRDAGWPVRIVHRDIGHS